MEELPTDQQRLLLHHLGTFVFNKTRAYREVFADRLSRHPWRPAASRGVLTTRSASDGRSNSYDDPMSLHVTDLCDAAKRCKSAGCTSALNPSPPLEAPGPGSAGPAVRSVQGLPGKRRIPDYMARSVIKAPTDLFLLKRWFILVLKKWSMPADR